MAEAEPPKTSRLRRVPVWLPYTALIVGIGLGTIRGVRKWQRDKADWRYWRLVAVTPLDVITVPRGDMYGFLPGFKALLVPFVAAAPIGYFIFAAVNAAACVGIVRILARQVSFLSSAGAPRSPPRMWLSVCAAVPCYYVLQNNQVVAPAILLALYGFVLVERQRDIPGGICMALAALVKTVPLPLFVVPLFLGRWKATVAAALTLCLLSFGLTIATDGVAGSVRAHLAWPSQALSQRPVLAWSPNQEPISFAQNYSPAAEVVRVARWTGTRAPVWAHGLAGILSFGLLAVLSARARRQAGLYWPVVACWMAWVAFASPYGRYYYLLLLVPAWYFLGLSAGKETAWQRLPWFLPIPLLAFWVRGIDPAYALVSTGTLFLLLVVLVRRQRNLPATARRGPTATGKRRMPNV